MKKIAGLVTGLLLTTTALAGYPEPQVKEGLKKTSRPEIRDVVPGTLWVDAEDFADYGGWYHDTQFIHLMGSGFLLAPGLGTPVDDAVTSVMLSEEGTYTLWVRSHNWQPTAAAIWQDWTSTG